MKRTVRATLIKWCCGTGFANCVHYGEVEVDDDATNEKIDEIVREEVFEYIGWGWEKVSESDEQSQRSFLNFSGQTD